MTWLVIIIVAFSFICCLAVFSFLTYYFQIKEYSFARLSSAISEQGLLFFLLPERIYFPKISVRNKTIFRIVLALLVVYFCFTFLLTFALPVKLFLILVSPLFAVFAVVIGVVITEKIAVKKRY